ncbi:hypothetical protein BC628DRAFT_1342590 [Trametes gibbosa]|nr:hypothetical protein BC628DRAFT_1342590 [Trametes gibbosa]
MSQFPPSNTFTTQTPPAHHIHHPSDPLPGTRGAAAHPPNYSAEVTNDSRNEREFSACTDTSAVIAGGQHSASPTTMSSEGDRTSALTEGRRMGVQPTERGGVAACDDPSLPEGKAKLTDKIIGKTQKATGKLTHNAAMREKGELREAGGKEAAQGLARAPHD